MKQPKDWFEWCVVVFATLMWLGAVGLAWSASGDSARKTDALERIADALEKGCRR